jgi:programmed cell death protein 5
LSSYEPARSSKEEEDKKAFKTQTLRIYLTPEARLRIANLRMVKPEVADFVENQLLQLAASGKLRRQITDDEVKEILINMAQKEKREFRMRRM